MENMETGNCNWTWTVVIYLDLNSSTIDKLGVWCLERMVDPQAI